ncbi:MAG: hypothetical protein A3B96_03285 [Candidatus Spechtbacteria bacterium RIFCSPHIGHO2_02_FULL_43_15b]|nr:MAG: hypothetical protein A3B96_03285 [Candidatus Spechtbacteria bacterium RIFCSPHIGHO2_02_FULL_43_15b]
MEVAMLEFEEICERIERIKLEVKKRIEGYDALIDLSLVAMVASGHLLYTGVPGLAKSLLAKTVAEVSGCTFSRIQLKIDMTPSDIIGTEIWRPDIKNFEMRHGPIFANFVVADEINRTPPKTQSAFLEAMQEKTVSFTFSRTIDLPRPFIVIATRNPIDHDGVFPLPEAQLDRFMFELMFPYPSEDDEIKVAKQVTEDSVGVQKISSPEELISIAEFVNKGIYVNDRIYRYIVKLIRCTRNSENNLIELGASPRTTKMCVRAAKGHALVIRRSDSVIPEDVDAVALPLLKPRLMMNFQWQGGESDWQTLVSDIISKARGEHVENAY